MNTQLHGYRQGHQLLDSTISLSKSDQSIVDRLSDIAGPLRPGELFEPYLSAYPLPSSRFYVLARTWQDLTVPRDGCVRTLSVIIPAAEWQCAPTLQSFLGLLDPDTFPSTAAIAKLTGAPAVQLPQTPEFRASELLEALFLEEPKPVALFDAPAPELIAVRLLTAIWPALRGRFALCTFALSPRKIEGRNFDLVFAPKDARARFADWRRIDARSGMAARHRWTSEIVERVFQSPLPRLLADHEIRLIGEEESGTPAALRIALLWDELLAKLEHSPSAALGLLDIANSKMHNSSTALHDLQPILAIAAKRAAEKLPTEEAWEFFGAMVRKIFGTQFSRAFPSVSAAVNVLTGRAPAGAIELLDRADGDSAIAAIVPAIANGLAEHFGDAAELALEAASWSTFKQLILADFRLARVCLAYNALLVRLAHMITNLERARFVLLRDEIMPAIVDDRHFILARSFFGSLDVDGILAEVENLNKANQFQSKSLLLPLIERGRQLCAIEDLRNALLSFEQSVGRNEFLRMTLSPTVDDAWWLLRQTSIGTERTNLFLQDMVRQADTQQFHNLLAHDSLTPLLLERLSGARDLQLRAVTEGQLPLMLRVPVVLQLLPESSEQQRHELATNLIYDCLSEHFGGDERGVLSTLFAILGAFVDGGRVVRTGLRRAVPTSVINRNIGAFNAAPQPTRHQILSAIEELTEKLAQRSPLELNEDAAFACAALLWDAQSVDLAGLLRGAGRLLPTLFRSAQEPVSVIVAAVFPLIYRELAREGDLPDWLKFVPFMDWDRCKRARQELVDTFLSSLIWRPCDLALTACRSSDVDRILRRVAKSEQGKSYILLIDKDLGALPCDCQSLVKQSILDIQSDWTSFS